MADRAAWGLPGSFLALLAMSPPGSPSRLRLGLGQPDAGRVPSGLFYGGQARPSPHTHHQPPRWGFPPRVRGPYIGRRELRNRSEAGVDKNDHL